MCLLLRPNDEICCILRMSRIDFTGFVDRYELQANYRLLLDLSPLPFLIKDLMKC